MTAEAKAEAESFLAALFADAPGAVALSSTARNFAARYYSPSEIGRAARDAVHEGTSADVYVSALPSHPTPNGRTKAETTSGLVAVFADLDIAGDGHAPGGLPHPTLEEAQKIVGAVGLPPSLVVWSGNGVHVWWRLTAPIEFFDEDDRRHGLALVKAFGDTVRLRGLEMGRHVDDVGDGARLLRVPGTLNLKSRSTPKPVTVIHRADGALYSESDLRDVIASEDERERLRPHQAPASAPSERYEPGAGLADAFAAIVSWADILTPHGWQCVGRTGLYGGAELWRRPGSAAEYSAYALDDPPVLVNFSSTAEAAYGIPAGDGHKLTKFRVWAIVNYAGDVRRAAAALAELGREAAAA